MVFSVKRLAITQWVLFCRVLPKETTMKIQPMPRWLPKKYNIETRAVDLTPVKEAELKALDGVAVMNAAALSNIAPRFRVLTLYAVAAPYNINPNPSISNDVFGFVVFI